MTTTPTNDHGSATNHQFQVQVHSNQPRAALAAAIAEEGYQVAP